MKSSVPGASDPVPTPSAFTDGFGDRYRTVVRDRALEVLTLREVFGARPSFEPALRERVSRLAAFRHDRYGRVLGVERLDDRASTLGLVSEHVNGLRLSTLLSLLPQRAVPLDIDAALSLIRQLLPAVTALHDYAPDVCHGALGPERLVVTPDGRLLVVEHVFGSALDHLQLSHQGYWQDLRVALPQTAGAPRFDRRTDVTQIGAVALALVLGRVLEEDEYPGHLVELVGNAEALSAMGHRAPLPPALRRWLGRALQIDQRRSFSTVQEAQADLDRLLEDHAPEPQLAALQTFLHRYHTGDAPAVIAPPDPGDMPVEREYPASAAPLHLAQAPAAVPVEPAVVMRSPEPDPALMPPPGRAAAADRAPAPAVAIEPARAASTWKRVESSRRPLIAAAVILVVLTIGFLVPWRSAPTEIEEDAVPEVGTLSVSTTPPGALAFVDGQRRGTTPLVIELAPGTHVLELVANGTNRRIPVTIRAGVELSQVVELPALRTNVGSLNVRTDPPGATVSVDGHDFGRSPVTVDGLTPGTHNVAVDNEHGRSAHEVLIEGGATASLVVTMPGPATPAAGWIAIRTPEEVDVYASGRLIGSSRSERIMMPAGRHELELVNEGLGFRSVQVVQVQPAAAVQVTPQWPEGTLAINATPWAEVWIGGRRIGETPIGSVRLPVGLHEVVFRHPELGEQRQSVVVTSLAQARASADLRR